MSTWGNGQVKPAHRSYPKTKKGVRSFLGLTGYYRRFIADYAKLALPLSDLTKKSLHDKVHWTQECENAFGALKQALCNSPIIFITKPQILADAFCLWSRSGRCFESER